MRRSTLGVFVGAGLVVALALAFFVSPEASSAPDGLEKVAIDEGFIETADEHDLAGSPLADYAVDGIDDERLSTGIAGAIGVLATFALGAGFMLVIRRVQRRREAPVA